MFDKFMLVLFPEDFLRETAIFNLKKYGNFKASIISYSFVVIHVLVNVLFETNKIYFKF